MLTKSEKLLRKINTLTDLIDQDTDLFIEQRKLWQRQHEVKLALKKAAGEFSKNEL